MQRIGLAFTVSLLLLAPAGGRPGGIPLGTRVALAARDQPDRPPAAGLFLVARRGLSDGNFERTVVFLLRHGEEGSVGLIVNRASRMRLSDAMPDIKESEAARHRLFFGGPVALARIVMLMRNERASAWVERVADDIYFSADRGVLDAVLSRKKPVSELRLYLGHAGWAPGQLDQELARGDWHLAEGDAESIFAAEPESLWEKLIRKIEPVGIQVRSGHGIPRPLLRGGPRFGDEAAMTPGRLVSRSD